jgi:hypothetical protein
MPNFMQKMALILFLACLLIALNAYSNTPLLIEDSANTFGPPAHLRTTQEHVPKTIVATDLSTLHLIGSGQFSEKNLVYVLGHYPKPRYIIDLRQESHGFVNGIAISWQGQNNWSNLHNSDSQNFRLEKQLLAQLAHKKNVEIHKVVSKRDGNIEQTQPYEITPQTIMSEQELAKKYHIGYVRLYVTDHQAPSPLIVDQLIKIVKKTPANDWLYLHCKGGKGRTTTFMTLIDMMHTAKQLSFDQILARQHAIGGINFFKISPKKSAVLQNEAQRRIAFLKQFYQYAKTNQDNFRTSWSKWLKQQGM